MKVKNSKYYIIKKPAIYTFYSIFEVLCTLKLSDQDVLCQAIRDNHYGEFLCDISRVQELIIRKDYQWTRCNNQRDKFSMLSLYPHLLLLPFSELFSLLLSQSFRFHLLQLLISRVIPFLTRNNSQMLNCTRIIYHFELIFFFNIQGGLIKK